MHHKKLVLIVLILIVLIIPALAQDQEEQLMNTVEPALLTDPFLQLPTATTVNVVWFTEFEGSDHIVTVDGDNIFDAETIELSRTREDSDSWVFREDERELSFDTPVRRHIWRHEATITDLSTGEALPYSVSSTFSDGTVITSDEFTLSPLPAAGTDLKILLTSDHQNMPMTPANLQKVTETIGNIDAVFFAGDLVNEPDRAGEWFDYGNGGGFFKSLQGNSELVLDWDESGTAYTGGEIIQSAPIFPVIGNHEVMGRFSMDGGSIADQFQLPRPISAAEALYEQNADLINPDNDPAIKQRFIEDNSYNTATYEEIFTLPENSPGGETYYSVQYGDVYLISLYATRIWRTGKVKPNVRGKYVEPLFDSENPGNWGYGEFIFEPIKAGSEQYDWLKAELNSEAFKNAPYKVVMLHHPFHTLGGNVTPAYTDPVQVVDRDEDGNITAIRYEYPINDDYLINDVQPLLQDAGVDLVLVGHSHVYNRFQDEAGVHHLETSNVGNSYDAFVETTAPRRNVPSDMTNFNEENYALYGDPYKLEPIMPSVAPLTDDDGNPQPFIASDEITVFSVFFTGEGVIRSYYFDTTLPDSEVVFFDEFSLED